MAMIMLTEIGIRSVLIGGIAGLFVLGALAWSFAFPQKRTWPPKKATNGIELLVWTATIAIFAAAFLPGLFG